MRGLIENRFGLLCLVIVALAALHGVAQGTRPAPVSAIASAPARVPVESVRVVCPDPSAGEDLRTWTGVVTPPGGRGTGRTEVRPLVGAPLAALDRPGRVWFREFKAAAQPVIVSSTGVMAAGLEAEQTSRADKGDQRGLAAVRCQEPGPSSWFVGPGPASASDVTLHLINADQAVASAEIHMLSGEGPVIAETGHGLTLQPGEHRVVRLRDLAPTPQIMALQVRTSGGRVAAAVRVGIGPGKGVDWLPAAVEPATRLVIPGVPGGTTRRELYVAAPGETDVMVRIKAVTADGAYALKGRDVLDVPAGSVGVIDLGPGLGQQSAAIQLSADAPMVAGLMVATADEVGFTSAAPALDIGSVVADNRGLPGQSTRLILSAPVTGAKVRIQLLPQAGATAPVGAAQAGVSAEPPPQIVELAAARTKEVRLTPPPGSESGYGVVVLPMPGSGPVYGGRVLEERGLFTVQPLALARTLATVPRVVDSMTAVIR